MMLLGQKRFLLLLGWTCMCGTLFAYNYYQKQLDPNNSNTSKSGPNPVMPSAMQMIHRHNQPVPTAAVSLGYSKFIYQRPRKPIHSPFKTFRDRQRLSTRTKPKDGRRIFRIAPQLQSARLAATMSKSPLAARLASTSSSSSSSSPLLLASASLAEQQIINDSIASAGEGDPSSNSAKSEAESGGGNPYPNPNSKERPTLRELPAERPKKFSFDQAEIEDAQQYIIDKPDFCDSDKGATLDFLVIVISAVHDFDERAAIRQTWGRFVVERGSLLLFILGKSNDPGVTARLMAEDEEHEDILQAAFTDSYYNLTLKTMSMMHWLVEHCDQVKYVLKVDDDMFVNMQMMVDFSETRTFKKAIIGHIAKRWKPHRDKKSKWYVPPAIYNETYYPNFATGPSYLVSGDAILPLFKQSLISTPIFLEDVFMTGIVAEKAGIRRLNYSLMKNVKVKVDACTFKRFLTSHKHSASEIIRLWKEVYEEPAKPCPKPRAPKAAAKVAKVKKTK